VVFFCAITMLPGLGSHGLWEPWEVDRLEAAIAPDMPELEVMQPQSRDRLWTALSASAVENGSSEAGVRLPSALAGLAILMASLLLGAALFGWRSALIATVVFAGLPLFWVTGRLMIFSPFPILAHVLVVGGVALAFFGPFRTMTNGTIGLIVAAGGLVIGELSAGWAPGCVLPLACAVIGGGLARPWRRGPWVLTFWILCLTALLVLIGFDLLTQDLSLLSPGRGSGSFVVYLRRLALGTFPWTGLLVVGFGAIAAPEELDDRRAGAAVILASSAAITFGAQTFWIGAWGHLPFLALWPLAMGAGLVLETSSQESRSRKIVALVCGMILLLGLRDLLLEPQSVLEALGDSGAEFPAGVDGKLWFALVTLLIGAPLVLGLARGSDEALSGWFGEWLTRYFGWLRSLSGRGAPFKWLLISVPSLLLVHSLLVLASPPVLWFPLLSCLESRIWIAAGLLVPLGLALALMGKLAWVLTGAARRIIVPTIMVVGMGITLISVHVMIPAFSIHFSSRGVVMAYERIRQGDEPLLSYRSSTRAVELLGDTEVEQVSTAEGLVERLEGRSKVFALIQDEDLAKVDVLYRQKMESHVPVIDMSSSKTLLLSNGLDEGQRNLNPLVEIVPLRRPRPMQPVKANFDDRIELFGLDIEGPGGTDTVCSMSSFKIRFYWHCLRPVTGNQQVFVHIDGYGQRINGDHYPADSMYLVRHWREGDIIIDEMTLSVPAHYHPGDYSVYVGWFLGSNRMPVKSGPGTHDNRVKAGVLRVR
jgi:hypothetical protein